MGYGTKGYQIRIRRIEKIRMDKLSAHIDYDDDADDGDDDDDDDDE